MRDFIRWSFWIALVFCSACHRLHLNLVDSSVQKPSNVAVYFSIEDRDGIPVAGLNAKQFEIFEDNKLISEFESKQTILNPKVATIRYTMLLLDLSGSVTESGQMPLLQQAVSEFLAQMPPDEPVAVYGFDGREGVIPIAKFGAKDSVKSKRTDALSSFWAEDPSTNLNGAIIQAAKLLQKAEDASDVPLRFGTLVIFTDGTDRAHRATSKQAQRALYDADIDSYVIGLGGEVDEEEMKRLSTSGVVQLAKESDVVSSFHEMGERLKAEGTKYYLLSYCSPSRAGRHKIVLKTAVGKDKGKLGFAFDAEGFEPNCNPYTTPGFKPMEDAEKQEAERQRRMDKGVRNEKGIRQAVDDESPFAKPTDGDAAGDEESSKEKSALPPGPAY